MFHRLLGEQALCPTMQTGSGALGNTACLCSLGCPFTFPRTAVYFGWVPSLFDCKSQAVVLTHKWDVVVGTDGWARSVRCLDVTCGSTATSPSYVVFINTDKSTGTFIFNYYHFKSLFRGQGKAMWQRTSHCKDLSTLPAGYHQCGLSSMNTAGLALAAVGSNGCWAVCTSVQKYAFIWFVNLLFKATNY